MITAEEYDTIAANDPDGKATEPTRRDYDLFHAWIERTYGSSAVHHYYGME